MATFDQTHADVLNNMSPAAQNNRVGDAILQAFEGGLPDGAISTAEIENAAITKDKIAANVAGTGLTGGAGSALAVATNGVTPAMAALITSSVAVPVVIQYTVTADATGGLAIFNANAPFKFKIIDVLVQCTAANALGTLKLTTGAPADITDAIACAVDKAIGRAGSIDAATATIAANGTLKVISNGAGDRGLVTITAIKVA